MNLPAWTALPARIAIWLCPYLVLVTGRILFARWLIARLQRRRGGTRDRIFPTVAMPRKRPCGLGRPAVRKLPPEPALLCTMAALATLLSGAAIPLAPEMQIGQWKAPLHMLGNTSAALVYVLALEWLGAGLLFLAGHGSVRQPGRLSAWREAGLLLFDLLPVSLVVLSLVVTSGALDVRRQGSLRLTELIALQRGGLASGIDWSNARPLPGLVDALYPRWFAVFQPLALLLWLACATPLRPGPQVRMTFAWQAQALNRALLTSALFLGGWQGPFIEQCAWLGLLYTAVKAGIVTSIWVWAWASLPPPSLVVRTRVAWRMLVPVAALNLLLTSAIVARL